MSQRRSPSYQGLEPASERASKAARGSSRKRDTRCEVALRRALWQKGCRFLKNVASLPGRPDIVFPRARVVVFCDGDFWHGKDWESRQEKLRRGNNPDYWIAKIGRNRERDQSNTTELVRQGWTVLRVWESDIRADLERIVALMLEVLDDRGHRRSRPPTPVDATLASR